jgi:hypothetical protein
MPSLGIFGDSFASIHDTNTDHGWSYKIQEHFDHVGIHALNGASNDWIVDQFIMQHQNYDQVVIIWSSAARMWYPVESVNRLSGKDVLLQFWVSGMDFDHILKTHTVKSIKTMQAIRDMLEYIIPNEKALLTRDIIMLAGIKQIRPDAIIIPGFGGITEEIDATCQYMHNKYAKWSLFNIQREQYKIIKEGLNPDPLANHMSKENNEWVLKHVLSRLRGEFLDWDSNAWHLFKSKKELETYKDITYPEYKVIKFY